MQESLLQVKCIADPAHQLVQGHNITRHCQAHLHSVVQQQQQQHQNGAVPCERRGLFNRRGAAVCPAS